MENEKCKATLVVGDTTVTFEGPAQFVENQVARYTAGKVSDTPAADPRPTNDSGMNSQSGFTERELVKTKQPRGHHELVAVLAFALAGSGIEEFSEEEMRKAYLRAGMRPPKSVGQALRDAKNKFDYISPGGKRGTYRLSNHGDRVVRFDLPRGDSNG